MNTFVRIVEVWVPDRERTLLEFGGGLYGGAKSFAAVSRDMCFGRGEGLPGQAWESGRPIILKQLENPYFRRGRAAAATGLTCGIALPVFAGEVLNAVLVIFCGDDDDHVGAIEVWHNDPAESPDLGLDEGYYGRTAELFEFRSRHTHFRRGFGLPGLAWQSRLPVFMPDLGKSKRFLRADSARRVGINRGFALPCSTPGDHTYVMAFLSALATPIVRRFETWLPDVRGQQLLRQQGFCESEGELADDVAPVAGGEGAIGAALRSGAPAIVEEAAAQPGAVGARVRSAGLQSLVALPLLDAGRVTAVVAWYF